MRPIVCCLVPLVAALGLASPIAALGTATGQQAQPSEISRNANFVATQDNSAPSPDAPRVAEIDWNLARAAAREQAAQSGQTASAARIQSPASVQPSNPQAENARFTHLPVLVPQRDALGMSSEPVTLLFPHEFFYALSITGEGVVIEVFGTRLVHAVAPDAISQRRLSAGGPGAYRISATEYGRELHFNRFGAAYSVTVECEEPETDARCSSDDYARALADSLVIVAGSPGEGEE